MTVVRLGETRRRKMGMLLRVDDLIELRKFNTIIILYLEPRENNVRQVSTSRVKIKR